MRRFLTYFNALLLGVILGMVFLAVVHAVPLAPDRHAGDGIGIGERTLAVTMSVVRLVR